MAGRKQRVLAADHPELREAIQLRGELSFLQGNLASARADWSTALEMAERTLRPGHPEIAQILRLLALCARAFGDGSGSRELIERALERSAGNISETELLARFGPLVGRR